MSQVIVTCPDCSDEVEFEVSEKGVDATYYLEDDSDSISFDVKAKLNGKSKTCPRCGHRITLKMSAVLKAA